jgi:eukaryotic-like serine/threonine-protein kinase
MQHSRALRDALGTAENVRAPRASDSGVLPAVGTTSSQEADATANRRAPTRPAIPAEKRMGRYEIVRELGSGTMGTVFEAWDPQLERSVALKVLRKRNTEAFQHDLDRTRLVREAQALARLSHPNVVPVYDVAMTADEDGGERVFLTMEMVRGVTLRTWLTREPSWRKRLEVLIQAGEGLAAAHSVGLVHRDFKPDNVIVDEDGRALVVDFGLARGPASRFEASTLLGDAPSVSLPVTQTGMVLGTPVYMAPEQHAGYRVDPHADQFAFCVTAFEALYGKRPFPARDFHSLAHLKRTGAIADTKNPDIPQGIHAALIRGLSAKPDARWPSMEQLLVALRAEARPRRSARVARVMGLGVVGLAFAFASQTPARGVCEDGPQRWSEIWNTGVKSRLQIVFESTQSQVAQKQWVRLSQGIDDYGFAWMEAHRRACLAAASNAARADNDPRIRCLERRRLQVSTVLEAMATANADVVARAPEYVAALPRVRECDAPHPADPWLEADDPRTPLVEQMNVQLDLAQSWSIAGAPSRALGHATNAYVLAHGTGIDQLEAVAADRFGAAQVAMGQFEVALSHHQRAVALAHAHRLDTLHVSAIAHIVYIVGHQQHRGQEALDWVRMARAVVDGGTVDPRVRARLYENEAMVLWALGRHDDALAQMLDMLALRERDLPEEKMALAMALNNIGSLQDQRGQLRESRRNHERAGDIRERIVGEDHPDYAMTLANLSSNHFRNNEHELAIELGNRAAEIWTRSLGPSHPHIATVLNTVAAASIHLGRAEQGVESLRRVVELREQRGQSDPTQLATALGNLAAAHQLTAQWDEAEALLQRALVYYAAGGHDTNEMTAWIHFNLGVVDFHRGDIDRAETRLTESLDLWRSYRGDEHHELFHPTSMLGRVHLERGDRTRALAMLERSLSFLADQPVTPSRAYVEFLVARIQWERQIDRPTAWLRATEAAAVMNTTPPHFSAERTEVEQWIEAHKPDAYEEITPPTSRGSKTPHP